MIAAGTITVGYQAVHRVLTPQALRIGIVAAVAAAAVASVVGLLRQGAHGQRLSVMPTCRS